MQILRNSQPNQAAADLIEAALTNNSHVLLLLSGGSAAEVYKILSLRPLKIPLQLNVGQVDERYDVDPRHMDSNLQLIEQSGIINRLGAERFHPILTGKSRAEEVGAYNAWLSGQFGQPDIYKLAVLGIGEDGHTAGVLPDPDAKQFNTRFHNTDLVAGYDNTGPHPSRITLTLTALEHLDQAIVVAASPAKLAVIDQLNQDPLPTLPTGRQAGQAGPPLANLMPATILRTTQNVTIVTSKE